jgi:hypothetical protein
MLARLFLLKGPSQVEDSIEHFLEFFWPIHGSQLLKVFCCLTRNFKRDKRDNDACGFIYWRPVFSGGFEGVNLSWGEL